MTTAWQTAIAFTLDHEGGLVDHPADPGGLTNFGLSQRSYPDLDLRALTRAEAEGIYHRDYWAASGCHWLPGAVAIALFDDAVHSGPKAAVKRLQSILGVKADGRVVPATVAAAQAEAERRGAGSLGVEMVRQRAAFLTALIRRRSDDLAFLGGWWGRTVSLAALVSTYGGSS